MPNVEVQPATPQRWRDVVTVMGTRGDAAFCWCQFFRLRGRDWRTASRESNRRALRQQVETEDDAHPPGVLAYVDGEAVGWCAVAPKASYPRLEASPIARTLEGQRSPTTWSVTCFVVRPPARRDGLGVPLLEGAIELARSAGATLVEAYPVDPEHRTSVSSAELYHGTLSLFRKLGFTEVRRPYLSRAVVQLPLEDAPGLAM